MAVPTAAISGPKLGPESRRSGRASEIWRITGNTSVDGDQVSFSTNMKKPIGVIGGPCVLVSISGQTVTLELSSDIGTNTFDVEVFGYYM